MNIVIPMVGLGKRFSDAGFALPKPLINVKGKTIIEHAVQSFGIDGNYIFILRKTDFSEKLKDILKSIKPNCRVVEIDYITDGSVSSILLAKEFIDNDEELVTTNCDQRTEWNHNNFIQFCRNSNSDGVVVTYPYKEIKIGEKSPYSFIQIDSNGNAEKLEEKTAISELALCGIHYWKHGKDFVYSANEMIKNNDRVNNEFYVAKTYNYLIKNGLRIKHYPLNYGQFFSLGTPDDFYQYEKLSK